jgi:hypothetical protein
MIGWIRFQWAWWTRLRWQSREENKKETLALIADAERVIREAPGSKEAYAAQAVIDGLRSFVEEIYQT